MSTRRSCPRWWYRLVVGGLALLGAVVWVLGLLGIAGLPHWWSGAIELGRLGIGFLIALLAGAVTWIWRRVRRV
jgi:hypothetical protein